MKTKTKNRNCSGGNDTFTVRLTNRNGDSYDAITLICDVCGSESVLRIGQPQIEVRWGPGTGALCPDPVLSEADE